MNEVKRETRGMPCAYPQEVNRFGKKLCYWIANEFCKWRVDTLFKKEPATLAWLERLPTGSHLLDVGANVGMYTVYAAVLKEVYVTAFEPESQNFALLCKNIHLNQIQHLVTPYSIGLSNTSGLSKLFLSSFTWDGASSCHSIGEEVGFDLKPRSSPFAQGTAAFRLDDIIKQAGQQAIRVPNAIKIDVDGFEHLVVEGAMETLARPEVRSLCIEVNMNLPEHQQMIEQLSELGFHHSPEQVERSTRQEGAFRGCAEVVFDRLDKAKVRIVNEWETLGDGESCSYAIQFNNTSKKVEAAALEIDPFPCIYLQNIFDEELYSAMKHFFPSHTQMSSLGSTGRVSKGAYAERLVTLLNEDGISVLDTEQQRFWRSLARELMSPEFIRTCLEKFGPWCNNRLAELVDKYGEACIRGDALLVSDKTNYAIGPHTDLPHRLLSLLFYLPDNEGLKHLGTSLYKHKDPKFICPGGPHYGFEDFERLGSAPYVPNSLLMFVRTGRSFHGVEPIKQEGIERHLLIYNIRVVES